ncbi:MAG: tripartite tricarboxylate transporter substrate binding protein [Sutterellaceae bacterium]|nr:tripartite tricarboxylate transporter substrate binding protein [Sutterellaceae bacterium]MDD7442229.1 tripartite tricarboxylate transporter substrate binding protein [Sutterellaceae bacterium]MDY2868602.1 tripartite tricarboxylate transporter substrate binding protein [Mesosutterella sp.]
MNRRTFASAAAAAILTAVTGPALALGSRPTTIVVPWPAGGPLDVSARTLADAVKDTLGTVVVENRPGAGGTRGVSSVAKAKADGKTLVVGAVATHAINPSLFKKLPYDPVKDFQPITLIAHVPNVLVITPEFQKQSGIKSVKDLIAYAKKNPGKLNFASGGNGSAGHLAGELLKAEAGLDIVHVPFQGAGPAKLSVLSGQTQLIFDNLASATSNIAAGKFIPLAVTTARRAKALPNVPTMQECGVKNFDISTWYGLFAPAKTPKDEVAKLNKAFTDALKSKAVSDRLAKLGGEASPTTPEQFADLIQHEIPKYAKIVKVSGAHVD